MRHILTDLRGNPIYSSYGSWRNNHHHHHHGATATNVVVVNPRTLLFLYVTASSWDETVRRATSHPHEVVTVDEQGGTPLHRACQLDPPPHVVVALKAAVGRSNLVGMTPLHVAASHRCNAGTLATLIDLHPTALRQVSHTGLRTPLHYACMSYRGLDLVAFQVLLERTLEESRRHLEEEQQRQREERLVVLRTQDEEDGEDVAGGSRQSVGDGTAGTGEMDDQHQQQQPLLLPQQQQGWKITDFFDILCEERDGNDDDTIDDEEVSVMVVNEMSRQYQQKIAAINNGSNNGSSNQRTSSSSMGNDVESVTAVDENNQLEGDGEEEDDDDDEEDGLEDGNRNVSNVVTWKDSTGHTPLGLLFRRYRERVRSVIAVLEQIRAASTADGAAAAVGNTIGPGAVHHPRPTPTTSPTSLQTDLGHLWGKARLIVARLTEEQQQQLRHDKQQQEQLGRRNPPSSSSLTRSSPTTVREASDDDSSTFGEHWTAAAAWSKERFHQSKNGQGLVPPVSGWADAGIVQTTDGEDVHDDVDSGSDEEETRGGQMVDHAVGIRDGSPPPPLPTPEVRQFRIVHASVGLTGYGCPPEMIRLAISIHPHQVREMDEDGNLPLHIAATASSFGTLASNIAMTDEESSVFSDSMASLFSSESSRRARGNGSGNTSPNNVASFDKVIKLLLKQYPQAAQTPHGRSGRLPLVLAARAGHRTWNDGMKTLLRAYPPALFSGSKGMVPVKLYPYVLSLIGGGGPPPTREPSAGGAGGSPASLGTGSNHSCGSGTYYGGASSSFNGRCGHRFNGRGGIGMLHNLLLLKQRHMRELMASGVPAGTSNGTPFVATPPRRQRNHLQRDYHSSALTGGSGHSGYQRSRNSSWSSSSHHAAGSSIGSNGNNNNVRMINNNLIHETQGASKGATNGKANKGTKVDPKLATTMFELLRTKPDLVEAGRSYQAELKRASAGGRKVASFGGKFLSQGHEQQPPLLPTRKKTMSRKLLERMTVFERKARKPSAA